MFFYFHFSFEYDTFLQPSHGAKVVPLVPPSKEQIKPIRELKKKITDACTHFVCEDAIRLTMLQNMV